MSQPELSVDFLDDALADLGSRQNVLSKAAAAFDVAARGAKAVVIFGCGHLGKIAISGAINAGLRLVALADNNKELWGQTIAGVPVMSPEDAVAHHNGDAFFLVAVYNSAAPHDQLRRLRCDRIVPFPLFFWRFSESISVLGLSLPGLILDHLTEIKQAYAFLDDDKSRREFASQIQWRCSLNYGCLPRPSLGADTYFDPDLVRLTRDEVFADCGAFNGDSVRMFLDKATQGYRHIYALEPDFRNRAALSAFTSSLPKGEGDRVSILPFAVGDYDGLITFNTTGTAGSNTKAVPGAETVECRRLDGLFGDLPPTFIKMDIEGAEPLAIRGAAELIRHARPILAICAYHYCEHLWTFPMLLKEILPDYRVSLRRYAEECWETVYYAIPPERSIRK